MDRETLNKLKYLINKKTAIEDICDILERDLHEIHAMVRALKSMGYSYDLSAMQPIKTSGARSGPPVNIDINNRQAFCLLSDVHYGSQWDRPDIMRQIYAECEEKGISTIFCAGDLTEGFYPRRPSHDGNYKVRGANAMIEYVVNTHPYSRYIKFYTIGGNHDASFRQSDGLDVIAEIAKVRSDIVYLGQDIADLNIGKISMRIAHGCDNRKKDLTARNTKFYNKIAEDAKPDILQLGHIHHSMYTQINGTHIFQTAALIDETSFGKTYGLEVERSCWFVSVEYDDEGNIYRVIPEIENFGPVRTRRKK